MIYIYIIILILALAGALIKPFWYSLRVKRIGKLGKKYNLSFKTSLRKFLGIYWVWWPVDIDRLEGNIFGHNILIVDQLPAALLGDRPTRPYTSMKIDGKEIKPRTFSIGWFKPAAMLDQILVNLEKGIEPEYK